MLETGHSPSSRGDPAGRPFLSRLCGYLLPALIPPIHMAVLAAYWSAYNLVVRRDDCSCSCWDTVFKGVYEQGEDTGYKHLYFNATPESARMWLLTVACVIVLYETVCHVTTLVVRRRARLAMVLLYGVSLFPHYFAWWVTLNYWNDGFYGQWNHQMFFNVTELASTVLVYQLVDAERPLTSWRVLAISGIAVMHVMLGSYDQFVDNVIRGKGDLETIIRDLGLMLPDLLHVVLPIEELIRDRKARVDKRDVVIVVVLVLFGCLVCSYL